MTCANCNREALYVYAPRGLVPTNYCNEHLPRRLRKATEVDGLTKTDAFRSKEVQVLAMLSPEPDSTSIEALLAEAVEPEEAPKKRRRRKPVGTAHDDQPAEETEEAVEDEAPADEEAAEEA